MRDRVILHCDLNNFFASVSLLFSPTLVREPVAVCGSVEERHGIVLAKNEIAKKFGVKTAETVWEAKSKCPDLITLPPIYEKYKEYSVRACEIYERYTDLVEPFGIDECWLDVTGSVFLFGNGEEIANRIRKEIKSELGITISVGVSFNKVFAKLGSDMKKPDAVTVISRENFKEKVWRLPVGDLLFVGKKTAERLNRMGVFTIGDLTACDEKMLKKALGKNGADLKNYALGIDDSPVSPITEDYCPKSVGRSVTPSSDITDRQSVWKIYLELAEDISGTLRKKHLSAFGICIHTRTVSLNIKESTKSFKTGTNCSITLAKRAMEFFDEVYDFKSPLRSVGFRAVNLKPDEEIGEQQDMFGTFETNRHDESIEKSMLIVREKFGNKSIKRAATIEK